MAAPATAPPEQDRLKSLLEEEHRILRDVFKTDMNDVKTLLERIDTYLRELDRREDTYTLKELLLESREIAYDIEDLLDGLIKQPSKKCLGFVSRIRRSIKLLGSFKQTSIQIRDMRARLHVINEKYLSAINATDRGTPANATRYKMDDRQLSSLSLAESGLIGIDDYRKELMNLVLTEEEPLRVISVVGMAGLGKTTLLMNLYNNSEVRGWFQCQMWIVLTPSFKIIDLLRSMVYQIYEEQQEKMPENIDAMDVIQLEELIRQCLKGKRYILVLDDVWNSTVWEHLKYALPDDSCGSRIIVGTRVREVGSAFQLSSPVQPYFLKPLSDHSAWRLFCNKAFHSESCPEGLNNLSQQIVNKCAGLPLVIVVIGGLLSQYRENSAAKWQEVFDGLNWRETKNLKLDHVMKSLLICYNDLPYPLKSCFLYFSMFPKNYSIKRMTLIRLWIAEGFVEKRERETLEEVAEDYLDKLINRSMVEVAEYYDHGKIRSCRIHNLFRESIVLKSEEENFCTSLTRETKAVDGTVRRLSVFDTNDDFLQETNPYHLRALIIFRSNAVSPSFLRRFFIEFRLLRILDLEGAPVEMFPLELGNLIHLRYLSLRNTRISKLPKSLKKLINLQTLDLKGTYVSHLPSEITKLKNLRHLLCYQYYIGSEPPYYYALGVRVPRGIEALTELQKLMYINADQESGVLRKLANLTQLKRLGIVKLREGDGAELCSSVAKMEGLVSFSVASVNTQEYLDLESLNHPPQNIERLYLKGHLRAFPQWVYGLERLAVMRLRWSKLAEASLSALPRLPLIELALIQAYDGKSLQFNEGFAKLKILSLDSLDNLQDISVEGSMPNLQKLCIRSCEKLVTVPVGIEHLSNLKELHLLNMPKELLNKLKEGGTDHEKIKHIPVIRYYNNREGLYDR